MEDNEIIALLFERDERALGEAKEKYGALCQSIGKKILCSNEDSEECENDTWLELWNTVPPEQPKSLKSYICGIMRNFSLKRLEYEIAQKRNRELLVSLTELEEILPDDKIAAEVSNRELHDALGTFLMAQKPLYRTVFMEHYRDYETIAEIARRHLCSESKVKSILFRMRKQLKQYLKQEGIGL